MRYKVEEGSLSGHCCFEATVIDTQEEDCGHPEWVCESFDELQAQKIAEALSQYDLFPVDIDAAAEEATASEERRDFDLSESFFYGYAAGYRDALNKVKDG